MTPNDSAIRPNWWEVYQDPQLNKLDEQVAVSNQTLKASDDKYVKARAAVEVSRLQYFPTLPASPAATRERESTNRPLYVPGTRRPTTIYFLRAGPAGNRISGVPSAERWNRSGLQLKLPPQILGTSISASVGARDK